MYLPRCETGSAHQVSAWLDLHVLIVLGTNFAQLKCRAHFTVQLVLLLWRKSGTAVTAGQTYAQMFDMHECMIANVQNMTPPTQISSSPV